MIDLQNAGGIIFDMDGVLVDSVSCHAEAFDVVFRGMGITDFHYPDYAGRRTTDVVREVLGRAGYNDSDLVAGKAREKSSLALRMIEERKPFAPGCEVALARLAARYPLALASSGSPASVTSFLRATGSASLFRSVLTGDDVVHAKPDPEIYIESARRLGQAPSKCVVIEDAVPGVISARASGASVVGIPGTSSATELTSAGAAFIASGPAEIADLMPSADAINRDNWTAVIPAAGRGSRLGFYRPKILYPVAGRPILDWLLDYLAPYCGRFVFVLSPEGHDDVAGELDRRIPGRFEIAIQQSPTGMGDAVALALPMVRSPHMALVWGDQVALRRSSVETCLRLHQGPLNPGATVPTVMRPDPYIHFERDSSGRLVEVLQAREGASMPPVGESDTGFFCFNPEKLTDWLREMRESGEGRGNGTGEFNLLPVIALAAARSVVLTPHIVTREETVGVNSPSDAAIAEDFLREAHAAGN